ncbi:helix-turn-helix domain-containing protein [Streptomyces coeruleoprunus]|uniref:Helix-turn-helix domain-containing protein n=1 Tax=Streptomyces coeruleoprunus TaxID=285563 RepID=A0ABV9XQ52_9ACTN
MARWKELPAGLDDRERRLVVQLRRLKDHSGLSLAALAGKTGYSRSSWERYLNGKQPVPRQAVEEMAQVCGADATRLVVLYELAAQARQDRAAGGGEGAGTAGTSGTSGERAPDADPVRDDAPGPPEPAPATPAAATGAAGRSRRMVPLGAVVVAGAVAVAVAFAAGLLTAGVWGGDQKPAGHAVADTGYLRGQTYRCEVRREGGELRAGHSATREMLLDINSTGFDVVEVQCLLREHGFDPGTTDGLYAESTKEAAKRFQQKRGLVVDGIVGPDTWRELRK